MKHHIVISIILACSTVSHAQTERTKIDIDRNLQVLPKQKKNLRKMLHKAARLLGENKIYLGGITIDRATLHYLGRTPKREPLLRAVREKLKKPLDLRDFIFFLDDAIRTFRAGRSKIIWLTNSRLRSAGIFLHPDDVFFDKPKIYGKSNKSLNIDRPTFPENLEKAKDGELLGPNWYLRYPNPRGVPSKLKELEALNPSGTFVDRITHLTEQLGKQGCHVSIYSTVRRKERGYLMWGAFSLSRAPNKHKAKALIKELNLVNKLWGLNIPITWSHPDGWQASVEAARKMADAYNVVYATKNGAKSSNHYEGKAIDFTVQNLPRQLILQAPDKGKKTFDLSAPWQSRDLNLTPKLIDWIEEHYQFKKLRSDYPHWNDAASLEKPKRRHKKDASSDV